MRAFLLNILLALAWAALHGEFSVLNLAVGFLMGFLALGLVLSARGRAGYFTRVPKLIGFLAFFLWELLLSNLRVAYDVVTPRYHMRPGVIAIPLDVRSEIEIVTLANLITLTPGTLSLDVSADRKVLYIHAMYLDDVAAFRQRIKEGFERRVREVMQ
ncbi:MAG: Na+/H+ antiporter subunit E [Candidatus Acidiferrales bacterium]